MEKAEEANAATSEEISLDAVPVKQEELIEEEKQVPTVKDSSHKRSKKEERQHKKEDRATDQFLKSLDSLSSPEEKLTTLKKKFIEVSDEIRRIQSFVHNSNKRFTAVLKEKEQQQLEYNRTVLVKAKLENLCRELQKQNKCIKDEALLRVREEEERRKETQAKFQTALTEITGLLQQNNDKNNKLRDDNISMSTKFKSVVEKYELREQQVEKMAKQMSLEQQLSEAKLAKASLEAQADKERLMTEIQHLKLELGQCQARIKESKNTEGALRDQLNVYTDKYDEFQNALVKSNQVFGGFKGEIDKMSKKILKLEKECVTWKSRWQASQSALLGMAAEKEAWDERAATAERKLAQLSKLCRSMQAERTLFINILKEHNIERPPMPVLPPSPPPVHTPASNNKVDAMAANCAQLKQSLAHLQSQLNVLTTKKEEENQAKEQVPKTKKGKKKNKDKEKTIQESKENDDEAVKQEDKEEIVCVKEETILESNSTEQTTIQNDNATVEQEASDSNTESMSVDDKANIVEITAQSNDLKEDTVDVPITESNPINGDANDVCVNLDKDIKNTSSIEINEAVEIKTTEESSKEKTQENVEHSSES